MHALGVLPGEQHLRRRASPHRQLGTDRDGVAEPRWPLGRSHAYAVFALAAPQLSRLASDVTQACEHGAGGGKEAVLTGRRRELGQPRPEDEAALHVARHEAVVLKGDGEAVSSGSGESGAGDQAGQSGGSGLEGREHEGGLVEHADSTRVVHMAILPSQIMGCKR